MMVKVLLEIELMVLSDDDEIDHVVGGGRSRSSRWTFTTKSHRRCPMMMTRLLKRLRLLTPHSNQSSNLVG
jgi:hypothetical protein